MSQLASTILAQVLKKSWDRSQQFFFSPAHHPKTGVIVVDQQTERSESLLILNTKGLSEKLVESVGQLQKFAKEKLAPHATDLPSGQRLARAWCSALRQHTETHKNALTAVHEEGLDLLMVIVENVSAILNLKE